MSAPGFFPVPPPDPTPCPRCGDPLVTTFGGEVRDRCTGPFCDNADPANVMEFAYNLASSYGLKLPKSMGAYHPGAGEKSAMYEAIVREGPGALWNSPDGYALIRLVRAAQNGDLSHVPPPSDWDTGQFEARGVDLARLRPVRFTYRPFVVCGRLNLVTGEEDIGKSTFQAHVAARLTKGELPGEFVGKPGNVLFVGADEDDWNEITVPRLHAAGADLERVFEFCPEDDLTVFNIEEHAAALDRELQERSYALVVFEQLMDVLPPMRNPTDPVAIRAALRPLRRVLRLREVAGLGTLHVNKAAVATLRQKMQGSVQFGALSRSTVLIDRHPEDEDRRVAVLGKANYVKNGEPRAVSFAIGSSTFLLNGQCFDVGVVADIRPEDLRVGDVLRPQTERDREREERAELLEDVLTNDPQSVRALADATDIPKSSVQRLLDDVLLPAKRAWKVDDGWVSHVPTPRDRDTGQATFDDELATEEEEAEAERLRSKWGS